MAKKIIRGAVAVSKAGAFYLVGFSSLSDAEMKKKAANFFGMESLHEQMVEVEIEIPEGETTALPVPP